MSKKKESKILDDTIQFIEDHTENAKMSDSEMLDYYRSIVGELNLRIENLEAEALK